MLALAALAGTPLAKTPRSSTAIDRWLIQSSSKAQAGGAEVSSSGFSTKRLVPGKRSRDCDGRAPGERQVRERVFTVTICGRQRSPSPAESRSWFPGGYRTEFTVVEDGQHTLLRIKGVIPSADVWLNAIWSLNTQPLPAPIPYMSST